MFAFTPHAVTKAKSFMTTAETAEHTKLVGLRVGVKGGGCSGFSYVMTAVQESDIDPDWGMTEQDGLKVYVDQMSAMYLEDVTVDYVEQMDGSGFKFMNPSVKSTCGCGQSFSV